MIDRIVYLGMVLTATVLAAGLSALVWYWAFASWGYCG